MFQNILFDLDGTLTDPKEGITKSVQYALQFFGIQEDNLDALIPYIGPPLKEGFMEHHGLSKEEALTAVAKYRERFAVTGLYENELFGGVEDLLIKLKEEGKKIAIASSKPEVFVKKILEHFLIDQYFDAIVGSELDGRRSAKAEVIQEAKVRLRLTKADEEHTVMIGDRKHDIEGARLGGISSIGVVFGYGGEEELRKEGATMLAYSMQELSKLLLK